MYKSLSVCVWMRVSGSELLPEHTGMAFCYCFLVKQLKKCLSHRKGFDIRPGVHFNIEYSFKLHYFRRSINFDIAECFILISYYVIIRMLKLNVQLLNICLDIKNVLNDSKTQFTFIGIFMNKSCILRISDVNIPFFMLYMAKIHRTLSVSDSFCHKSTEILDESFFNFVIKRNVLSHNFFLYF